LFIIVNIAAIPLCGSPTSQPRRARVFHHAGRATVDTQLVLYADDAQRIAFTQPPVGIRHDLWDHEEADTFRPFAAIR
jgi:hypothetical protein